MWRGIISAKGWRAPDERIAVERGVPLRSYEFETANVDSRGPVI
jgi:hypothetical protein